MGKNTFLTLSELMAEFGLVCIKNKYSKIKLLDVWTKQS